MWRTPVFWFSIVVAVATITAIKFDNAVSNAIDGHAHRVSGWCRAIVTGFIMVCAIVGALSRRHWFSAFAASFVTMYMTVMVSVVWSGVTHPVRYSDLLLLTGGMLPGVLFVVSLPMLALRFLWGWRLRHSSDPPESATGLRIIDLFELLTLANACFVGFRLQQAIDPAATQLTRKCGHVLFAEALTSTCILPVVTYSLLCQTRWRWGVLFVAWGGFYAIECGIASLPSDPYEHTFTSLTLFEFSLLPVIVIGFLVTLRHSGWRLARLSTLESLKVPRECARLPRWAPIVVITLAACIANWFAGFANQDRNFARQFERIARPSLTQNLLDVDRLDMIRPLSRYESLLLFQADDERLKASRVLRDVRGAYVTSDDSEYLNTEYVTDEGIAFLANLSSLEELVLYCRRMTNDGVRQLGRLRQLSSLSIHGASITDDAMDFLEQLPLQNIALADTSIGDGTCRRLERMNTLRSIRLINSRVTADGLRHLQSLPKLETLDATGVNYDGPVFDKGFLRLRSLDVSYSVLSNESLRDIVQLPNLDDLRLDGVATIDDDVVRLLSKRALRGLSLAKTAITDSALPYIAQESLSYLNVSGTRINGSGFRDCGTKFDDFLSLVLSNTQIVDENLRFLGSMEIEILDIAGTHVTKQGIINSGIKCHLLYLAPFQFEPNEIDEIREALGCDVSELGQPQDSSDSQSRQDCSS